MACAWQCWAWLVGTLLAANCFRLLPHGWLEPSVLSATKASMPWLAGTLRSVCHGSFCHGMPSCMHACFQGQTGLHA